MDGEEQGGEKRGARAAEERAHETVEEQDHRHVQGDVGQVEAKRIPPPRLEVGQVGEQDDGAVEGAVLPYAGAEVGREVLAQVVRALEMWIVDDEDGVVPDERIADGREVEGAGDQDENGGVEDGRAPPRAAHRARKLACTSPPLCRW